MNFKILNFGLRKFRGFHVSYCIVLCVNIGKSECESCSIATHFDIENLYKNLHVKYFGSSGDLAWTENDTTKLG